MREALLQALSEGGLLLAANRRLARRWRLEYDAEQQAAGLEAWSAPAVRAWSEWVEHAILDTLSPVVLPSSFAEQYAWELLIAADSADPLLDIAATARTAVAGWTFCQQYGVSLLHPGFEAVEDTARFRGWALGFERLASNRGWVPAAQRELWLAERLPQGLRTVWLDGFDEITPAQNALLERMPWRRYESGIPAAQRVQRAVYPSTREELHAAACWARQLLEEGGARSVGIVVNQLAQVRSLVEATFLDVLGAPLFNISLGIPLSQWPVIADALRFLRWTVSRLPVGEAGILLRSPFFSGGERDLLQRARVDRQWRDENRMEIAFELAPAALRTRVGKLALPKRQSAGAWARSFPKVLEAAGWPGERTLSSSERQAIARWTELLREFASLDQMEASLGFSQALHLLASLAGQSIFQPETEEMPVQILETLQAAGSRFDALWVTGLTDVSWPAPARPNPFLPKSLQRELQLPNATPARELAFAERITGRLLQSAPWVVFSYPQRVGDEELRPSRLLERFEERQPEVRSVMTPMRAQAFTAPLETVADQAGPVLDKDARPRGGVRLVNSQSVCPFSAFAKYRLQAEEWPDPQPGLSFLDRGKALHAALAALWREYPDKGRLQTAVGETDVLERAIREGLATLDSKGRERLLRLEGLRNREVILAFLDLDFARPDFVVEAIEQELDLNGAGLPLQARMDRVDRLSTGERVIVDYKSGAASANSWLGERPDDVQLPVYALALAEPPDAIAFASMKRGQYCFSGLAAREGILPQVGPPDEGWEEQLKSWRKIVSDLWSEFARGHAPVAPKGGDLPCARCHLHGLCRIHE